MKRTAWKLLAFVLASGLAATVACSSSSDDASVPSCKGPSAAETACNACEETSCAAEVSSVNAACGSYEVCFESCDCSDAACLSACSVGASTACQAAALSAGSSCTVCASVCNQSETTPPAIPTVGIAPAGDTFGGVVIGSACDGDIYVDGTAGGYLFCDDGVWAYTSDNPADDGYTLFAGGGDDAGEEDAGDDGGSIDSGSDDSGFDAGGSDEGGFEAGEDGGSDDSGADTGTEPSDASDAG